MRVSTAHFTILMLMLTVGLFHSAAYARSNNSQQMERMKLQFDAAITAGDVNKAKQIWSSIDSQFSNEHLDKMTARSVIFGGGALFRREQLQQLYANNPTQFKAIALFLSSINPSAFMGNTALTGTGKLSGKVRGKKRKLLSGAVVIVAGQQTVTDAKGTFSFRALPVGTYSLFVYAPSYKLNMDSRTVTANKSASVIFRLAASSSSRPALTRAQVENNIKKITEKLPAKSQPRTKGTEILVGTLLDAKTGAPITQAKVLLICEVKALQANQLPQAQVKEVKSDTSGRFTITNIPVGICEFSVAKTNVTMANFDKKARSGNAYAYAFSQKFRMTLKANHRHENTWKLSKKIMAAN